MTAVLTPAQMTAAVHAIGPADVREVLARSILADGLDFVLDIERSTGSILVDARTGERYLDMFTFFASSALGMNHPALADDEAFRAELAAAAVNKPSNSDVYSVPMARFVDTFARVLGDPALPHLFFVDGGALAVENALKVAFDWKSRHNEARGIDPDARHQGAAPARRLPRPQRLHAVADQHRPEQGRPVPEVRLAAHRRARTSDPDADMDAVEAESLRQARAAFEAHPHDIACFIAEPIQGEGGDRHFRPQFFAAMRELCDEFDALLIFDEVQTGCGLTGTAWAYQQLGVAPDVVAFGKKTQVCGVMAGGRVDEVADNVFAVSSRINSTWGGNLVDMVRSRRILEVIESDGLMEHAAEAGRYLHARLEELAAEFPGAGARRPRPRADARVQPAVGRAARRADRQAVGSPRRHARQRPRQCPVPARADGVVRRDRRRRRRRTRRAHARARSVSTAR